jgi:hypothetical protein
MDAYLTIRTMLRTVTNAPPNQVDLSFIFRDMRKHRWKRVVKQLKSSRGASLCALKDPSGLSILSVAVMSDPPLEILQFIIKLNPAASMEQDDYGSIPLHLACLNGASSEVIRILLEHDNGISAAVPDDMDRRVPLHHAVEFAARLDKKQLTNEGTDTFGFSDDDQPRAVLDADAGSGSSPPKRQNNDHATGSRKSYPYMSSSAVSSSSSVGEDALIISLLCEAVPDMVHYRSRSGETPMDIAHVVKELAETPKELERIEKCYSILQNTAIMLYKKNKKRWEDEGFIKVLNPDGMKMESFSIDTSTAESTNSSSLTVSNLSALPSLDPSMTASIQNTAHRSTATSMCTSRLNSVPLPITMQMQQQQQQSHPLTTAEMITNMLHSQNDVPHELKMHMMGFNIQHLTLHNESSYDHHVYHADSFQFSKEPNEYMFPCEVQSRIPHSPPGAYHYHHHHHHHHYHHYNTPPHAYHPNTFHVHPTHLYSNHQKEQQQQHQALETERISEPPTPEQLQNDNDMEECSDPSLLEDTYSIDDV